MSPLLRLPICVIGLLSATLVWPDDATACGRRSRCAPRYTVVCTPIYVTPIQQPPQTTDPDEAEFGKDLPKPPKPIEVPKVPPFEKLLPGDYSDEAPPKPSIGQLPAQDGTRAYARLATYPGRNPTRAEREFLGK
jgi:hypothetical protein